MNREIEKYTSKTFEEIKNIDEYGNEYWFARDLQKVLGYKDWRNFQKVIDKAIISANNSISNEENWVVEVNKPIKTGKGKEEFIIDYKLSRYICYLIVQNADPGKEVVALGQTSFAVQTRKQKLSRICFIYKIWKILVGLKKTLFSMRIELKQNKRENEVSI